MQLWTSGKGSCFLGFGIHKFHQYIYAREFTLVTDHKLLTTILGPKQSIPSLTTAQSQCWDCYWLDIHIVLPIISRYVHSCMHALDRHVVITV